MEGGTPSERTEIRVVYDEDAIYIGAILYDDPEEILAFQKRRDGFLSTDDRFMWILDTFRDGRTGYFFETNATGVMGDALIAGGSGGRGGGGFGGGGGGSSRAWDGIWQVKTLIGPDGWSLEIQMHLDPREDWLFSANDLKVDGERVKFHFGRMGDERKCRLKQQGESELVGECKRVNEPESQPPSRMVMRRPAGEPASD